MLRILTRYWSGILTRVGIQVAFGEISGVLGLKGGGQGTLGKRWTDIQQIGDINYYALGTALAVLVLLIGSKKCWRRLSRSKKPSCMSVGSCSIGKRYGAKGDGVFRSVLEEQCHCYARPGVVMLHNACNRVSGSKLLKNCLFYLLPPYYLPIFW
jgi:hypothetical protein